MLDYQHHKILLDDLALIRDELKRHHDVFKNHSYGYWKRFDELLETIDKSLNRHRVMENTRTDGYLTHQDFQNIFLMIDMIVEQTNKPFAVNIVKISSMLRNTGEISFEYSANMKTREELEKEQAKRDIKDFTKVATKEPVVLKSKINFSEGIVKHPLRDSLMVKSKSLEDYSRLLREELISLENSFPKYEDFFYEFESDRTGSWYNLKGTGV